ncbi:MAG: thioredoxin domain-containing protein [Natrialbaceae archaeon]|nr:thioredoxin domain-containing protein [Natrialbaceae archaeon]
MADIPALSRYQGQTTPNPRRGAGPLLPHLLEAHDLVLVDFYADWCGPCQMIAPVLDRLAADLPVTVLKVDTDVHQNLAANHGVRSLPTLMLVEHGEPCRAGDRRPGRSVDSVS